MVSCWPAAGRKSTADRDLNAAAVVDAALTPTSISWLHDADVNGFVAVDRYRSLVVTARHW